MRCESRSLKKLEYLRLPQFWFIFLFFFASSLILRAQPGTIAGFVIAAEDSSYLPGVNIELEGTGLGATTDAEGFYLIPNVPPGNHQLSASYIGFNKTTYTEVQVFVNLTTTINFHLQRKIYSSEEITVVADRPVIRQEVAATHITVEAKELQNLPIATIEDAIKLQPGIEPNLTIRGGKINTVSFLVDGINLREGRSNAPVMGLSYTALEQLQIQTGGFNAEHGNVRSGLIALVTKDPPRDKYTVDIFSRYRFTQPLSFDYPPTGPQALIFTERNKASAYDIDFTVGGPLLPFASKAIGNPRFLASVRNQSNPYIENFDRQERSEETIQLKLISDLSKKSRLTLMGLLSNVRGVADSVSTIMPAGTPAYPWGFENSFFRREGLFKNDNIGLADIKHRLISATYLHTINPSTFFEIKAHRLQSEYFLRPGLQERIIDRDTSDVVVWTGKFDLTSQISRHIRLKGGLEYLVSDYNISSEINDACGSRVSALGSAATLLCAGNIDFQSPYRIFEGWQAAPHQGAGYLQSKIELNKMILNLGARLDYFNSRGSRLRFDDFDQLLSQTDIQSRTDDLSATPAEKQLAISPRLGVSFLITIDSKLYFNYGHFRQMPQAQHLFSLQQKQFIVNRSSLTNIGNPDIPMPRTVAYEIGYEKSFSDQYLFRASAYLRDIDNQTSFRYYISEDVSYSLALPLNFNDASGFELTLSKNRGSWLRGFLNFTYQSFSTGNFGTSAVILDPLTGNDYSLNSQDHYQSKSASQPFARFNLEFLAPADFGPSLAGTRPFANWQMDILSQWRAGKVFTWGGPIEDEDDATFGIQYTPHPSLRNNLRTRDFFSLDLRLSKQFQHKLSGKGAVQLFVDINNLLNLKYMYFERPFAINEGNPFIDYNAYMASLHLPESTFENLGGEDIPYLFIPGNDRPGDFRKSGVAHVPINVVRHQYELPASSNDQALYYIHSEERYLQYQNGNWQTADAGYVSQILADKAYIDMPDKVDQIFLNPRSIIVGLRFSF